VVAVWGQWTTDDAIQGASGLVVAAGVAGDSRAVAQFPPSGRDYSDRAILLGRIKAGGAPESRRVVHVFELSPELRHATMVTATCGDALLVDDLQWLPRFAGMPCEECVVRSQRNAG
jgi:hypothetical protein